MSTNALPGGDDVNAVVLDIGAHSFRAGFAGEDVPRVVESSSWTGIPQSQQSSKPTPLNFAMHSPSCNGSISHAFTPDPKAGILNINEPIFEEIVKYSFKNAQRSFDIDFSDSPIILSEPNRRGSDKKFRKTCVESTLETFNFPAVSLIPRASAAAFAVGKPSGLVVDIGASMTSITPVFDGFVLQKPIAEFLGFGGDLLDTVLYEVLKKKKVSVPTYRKYETAPSDQFLHLSRIAVVRNLKHEVCKLSSSPLTGVAGYSNWNMAQPNPPIEPSLLPDGTPVDLGMITQMIPELLFDPAPLGAIPTMSAANFPGLVTAITDVVGNTDVDARKAVSSDIILTGGSSLFDGMPDRLLKGLSTGLPKCKVTAAPVGIDRMSGSWLGCSIIASCSTFQQLWISKSQLNEDGIDRVMSKQLFW
jgi:actin-related protein